MQQPVKLQGGIEWSYCRKHESPLHWQNMNLDEYTEFDAVALSDLVRKRDVSSAELIACAEDAIARINPAINAVIRPVHQDRDAPIQDGPFTGVPFLLKDLGHNFADIACTMGSRIGRGFVPKEDGPLAARFRASGLRPVGVTNSSEFGINGVTEPVAFGPTRNPWDPPAGPAAAPLPPWRPASYRWRTQVTAAVRYGSRRPGADWSASNRREDEIPWVAVPATTQQAGYRLSMSFRAACETQRRPWT